MIIYSRVPQENAYLLIDFELFSFSNSREPSTTGPRFLSFSDILEGERIQKPLIVFSLPLFPSPPHLCSAQMSFWSFHICIFYSQMDCKLFKRKNLVSWVFDTLHSFQLDAFLLSPAKIFLHGVYSSVGGYRFPQNIFNLLCLGCHYNLATDVILLW